MDYLMDLWLARERHEVLLREAAERRLVGQLRRARTRGADESPPDGEPADTGGRTEVRLGLPDDAARIANLLELRGIPRWVASEVRFIVAERGGEILAVLRFRRDPGRLRLGLLVTDPRAEEDPLAVLLFAGARPIARELGAGVILAGTRRPGTYLARAGYHEGREGWRTGAGDRRGR